MVNSLRFAPIVLGLVFLGLSLSARAEPGDVVRFGFAPEDGLTLIKSIETYTMQDFRGKAPTVETEIQSDIRLEFDRGEQGSWMVIMEPLWAKTVVDGATADNPAQEIAVGHQNRLFLDEQGKAVGGDGFDDLMRRFERELDPSMFARLRQGMSAESMKWGEIAEWNRPFEGLRGEEITVGQTWTVLSETTMQQSPVPLSGSLEFQGWTELDGYRVLKTIYRYDASGNVYAAAEEAASQTLNLRPAERESYSRHNLVIEGETTWLLVPEMGLVLYETHEETMQVPLSAQPDADRGVLVKRHTYRYRPASDDS